jgi:hypothetical protein
MRFVIREEDRDEQDQNDSASRPGAMATVITFIPVDPKSGANADTDAQTLPIVAWSPG